MVCFLGNRRTPESARVHGTITTIANLCHCHSNSFHLEMSLHDPFLLVQYKLSFSQWEAQLQGLCQGPRNVLFCRLLVELEESFLSFVLRFSPEQSTRVCLMIVHVKPQQQSVFYKGHQKATKPGLCGPSRVCSSIERPSHAPSGHPGRPQIGDTYEWRSTGRDWREKSLHWCKDRIMPLDFV